MIGKMINEITEQWPYVVVIILLCVLTASLYEQLQVARQNEYEMSRRVYQAVRQGYINTNAPYAK